MQVNESNQLTSTEVSIVDWCLTIKQKLPNGLEAFITMPYPPEDKDMCDKMHAKRKSLVSNAYFCCAVMRTAFRQLGQDYIPTKSRAEMFEEILSYEPMELPFTSFGVEIQRVGHYAATPNAKYMFTHRLLDGITVRTKGREVPGIIYGEVAGLNAPGAKIDMAKASHIFSDVRLLDGALIGNVTTLDSPAGRRLSRALNEGVSVAFALRFNTEEFHAPHGHEFPMLLSIDAVFPNPT